MIRYYILLIVFFACAAGGMCWGAWMNSKPLMIMGAVPGVIGIVAVCVWVDRYDHRIKERVTMQRARRAQAAWRCERGL